MELISTSQAVLKAISEEMVKNSTLFILGQDIGKLGSTWGVTSGLLNRFGSSRIIESPICETTMLNIGLGASINNVRCIINIQRIDYLMLSMSAIINEICKWEHFTGKKPNILIHTNTGALGQVGPQHSQSLESLFTHVPGIIVIMPSNAYEAKGLMKSALNHNGPVLFLDHIKLVKETMYIPKNEYYIEIGRAEVVKEGNELTLISNSYMIHRLAKILEQEAELSGRVELIDLRTICPIDYKTIIASLRKTGKILLVHEPYKIGGFGQQIISYVSETHFNLLKAPPAIVGAEHKPIPYNPRILETVVPSDKLILNRIIETLNL